MNIKELVKEATKNATAHGFYDQPIEFGTAIALIHAELSEALEEARAERDAVYVKDGKPEGYGIELADAVILIASICGSMKIDLEAAIELKMEYNKTRPYKHGKKF